MIVPLQADAAATLVRQVSQQAVHALILRGTDDFAAVTGLRYQASSGQFAQMMSQGGSWLIQQALQFADIESVATSPHQQPE